MTKCKHQHHPPADTGYWRKTHIASGVTVKMIVRKVPGKRLFEAQFVDDPQDRWYPVSQYASPLWSWAQL